MNNLILTFSMEDGSITLNRGVIEALGHPKQVQIRLDEENCQLMLRACNLEEDQAVVVQEEMPQVGGRRLLKRISGLAGWREPGDRFVYGVYLPDYGAAIFNLRDARPFSVLNDIPASGPMTGAEE